MCFTASIASRSSVSETGRPARRSSWMNPARTSIIAVRLLARRRELLLGLGEVGAVLEEDVQRVRRGGLVHRVDAEQHEGAGPVERLGDRGRLLQLERPQ